MSLSTLEDDIQYSVHNDKKQIHRIKQKVNIFFMIIGVGHEWGGGHNPVAIVTTMIFQHALAVQQN